MICTSEPSIDTNGLRFLVRQILHTFATSLYDSKRSMEGAVMLGDFEQVIYKIEEEDLFMIGTSEHAMASMHMNEILEGRQASDKIWGH